MGQGEAAIGVRSDVTIAIEGARSTPAIRLQQITDAAIDRVSELRSCYRDVASKRPTAAGALAVRVTLEADRKAPRFESFADTLSWTLALLERHDLTETCFFNHQRPEYGNVPVVSVVCPGLRMVIPENMKTER